MKNDIHIKILKKQHTKYTYDSNHKVHKKYMMNYLGVWKKILDGIYV